MSAQDRTPSATPPSFTRDVAPILARSCLSCHGPTQQMSLLDLSTRAAALKGGQKNGPAIVPGDSSKSPLYRRLTGQDQPAMPLGAQAQRCRDPNHQGLDRLPARFGTGGAPSLRRPPPPATAGGEKKFTDQDRAWWAFRAPVRHPLPACSGCAVERQPDRRVSETGAGRERAGACAAGRPPHADPPRLSRHDRAAAVARRGGGIR